MKKSFFQPGPADDLAYANVRDKPRPDGVTGRKVIPDLAAEEAHEFCEKLWVTYAPYADRHFLSEAKNQFQQRFWEMYLGVTLMKKGFELKKLGDEGPEFYFMCGGKKVWVEAVAPGPGTGPDAVPEQRLTGVVYDVPQEQILLRYTAALSDKLKNYNEAVKKGIVSDNDCYVVAVNCAWAGFIESYPVKAYLGVGDLTLEIDPRTNKTIDRYHKFRDQVTKENGSPVNTAPLLNTNYAGISGVLHSTVDAFNHPQLMGDDFEFLHNPLASQPIVRPAFSFCRQNVYSLERGELQTVEPSQVTGG